MRVHSVLLLTLLMSGSPQRPDIRVDGLKKRVFERINDQRIQNKLSPLKLDPKLTQAARNHSEDMADHNFIAHVNPAGQSPSDRAHAAGFECRKRIGAYVYSGVAENIYQNNLYSRTLTRGSQIVYQWNNDEVIAQSTVQGWMDSPGHRANILNPRFTLTGIGIAVSADYRIFITQDFC